MIRRGVARASAAALLLCAFSASSAGSETGATPGQSPRANESAVTLVDKAGARRLIDTLQGSPLTGSLASPLYVERHLPHQRGRRGDTSSDELVLLEDGTIAKHLGFDALRCKARIAEGKRADLDGDGIAASLDASVECGLRSETHTGLFNAEIAETDRSDEDWQAGFSQQRHLRFELRPIENDPAGTSLAGHRLIESHREVTLERVPRDGERANSGSSGSSASYRIDTRERQRLKTHGEAGELLRDEETDFELSASIDPESTQRGRAIDYTIDGVITSLSGTLRVQSKDPKTGLQSKSIFDVEAAHLPYRARRSGGQRCFFQEPYHGAIAVKDREGNTLEMVFHRDRCRASFLHNGEPLEPTR